MHNFIEFMYNFVNMYATCRLQKEKKANSSKYYFNDGNMLATQYAITKRSEI